MGQSTIANAMIMTAGLGTRLQPFTNVRTKALLPVLGIPSAQYALDSLVAAGVTKVVANVHHLAQDTARRMEELDLNGAELRIKDESSLLLGTAGGIRNALDELGSLPFFRANADVIYDIDWNALFQTHLELRRSRGVLITLAVLPSGPRDAQYPEILYDGNERLVTGIGKPQSSRPFWTGAAVIEPEALLGVTQDGPSEFVPEILAPAIRNQRAGVFVEDGLWYDIGSPSLWLDTHFDLMRLFESTHEKNDRIRLWEKRFLTTNDSLGKNCWAHTSQRTQLGKNTLEIQGPCYLGGVNQVGVEKVQVGPNAVIYDQMPPLGVKIENGIAFGGYWVKK